MLPPISIFRFSRLCCATPGGSIRSLPTEVSTKVNRRMPRVPHSHGGTPAFTAESRSPQGRGYSRFFELSPETVALPLIPNTYPRAQRLKIDSCAPAHFDLSVFPSMSLAFPGLDSFPAHRSLDEGESRMQRVPHSHGNTPASTAVQLMHRKRLMMYEGLVSLRAVGRNRGSAGYSKYVSSCE
jgi:hypothetical protein